jgi:hypothetical protein
MKRNFMSGIDGLNIRGLRPLQLVAHALAVVVLASGWQPGQAAERELPFQHDWYKTEIVIFERPAVTAWNAQEAVLIDDERAFPADILAFRATDEERLEILALPPETRAILDYPTYDPVMLEALGFLVESADDDRPVDEEADAVSDVASEETLEEPIETVAPTAAPPAPARSAHELLSESLDDAVVRFEEELLANSYRPLPRASLALRGEARAMARTGRYRVILHRAWVQPIPERRKGMPVLIQAGERFGDRWLIEGSVSVTLGRYLHIDVNLWHQGPLAPPPITPAVELRPAAAEPTIETPAGVETTGPELALDPVMRLPADGYMVLDERRRLRSEELHYLDHPKFGVLVRIDPIEPNETINLLVADLEALEEAR